MDIFIGLMPWVLPPILGALIGYGTNRIAIQMLFRPRTEKRVLGVRVPLTPGVIPNSRIELSRSVAQLVAQELLAPESVREQIGSPRLAAALKQWVGQQRRSLMRRPLFPPDGSDQLLIDALLDEALPPVLRSEYMARAVHRLSAILIAEVGAKRLAEIASADDVAEKIHDNLLPLLASPDLRANVSDVLKHWLDEQLVANRPLDDYVPDNVRRFLVNSMRDNIQAITESTVGILRRPVARDAMIRIGRALVEEAVEEQGLLARAVMRLSGKEREIMERMPETVDKMLDNVETVLNGENMQEELSSVLQGVVEQVLRSGAGDVLSGRRTDLHGVVDRVVDSSFDWIGSVSLADLKNATHRLYPSYSGLTVSELLERSTGMSESHVTDALAGVGLRYLHSDDAPGQVAGFIRNGLDPDHPLVLQDLVSLSHGLESQVDDYLTDRLVAFLHEHVPTLAEILDVERLVTDRIDSFNVVEVERMVLGITGRHLRWVNYFGAILGALIGLAQVLLFALT